MIDIEIALEKVRGQFFFNSNFLKDVKFYII